MGPNPQVFSQALTWLFLFPVDILKVLVKVWRKNDLSSVKCFLQDLLNSLHRWLNLFVWILPECLNNSWWCFSSSFLDIEDRWRLFLHIYPLSQRFVILACCHPLIIICDCEIFFLSIRCKFRSLFSLILWRPLFRDYSFSAFSYHSPILPVHRSSDL